MVKQRNLATLLEHDQLGTERNSGRCFTDFQEGVINFPPTYKYQPGTNHFETPEAAEQNKKKARVPAWCDRVLWQCNLQNGHNLVQQVSYFSCPEFTASDHKPVGSEFVLPLVELLSEKERKGLRRFSLAQALRGASLTRKAALSDPVNMPVPPGSSSELVPSAFSGTGDEDGDACKDLDSKGDVVPTSRGSPGYDMESHGWSSDSSNPSNSLADPVQSVCVIADVDAAHADELSVRKGDLLELFPDERLDLDDGWLLGKRVDTGEIGYVPVEALKPLGAVQPINETTTTEDRDEALKLSASRFHRMRENKRLEVENRPRTRMPTLKDDRASIIRNLKGLLMKQANRIRKTNLRWSEEYLLSPPRHREMVAAGDYSAKCEDELSFHTGQVLSVLSICPGLDSNRGWLMAKLPNGEQGLVPCALFEPLDL